MFHHQDGRLMECHYCLSPKVSRFGLTSGLNQRYRCKDCQRTFTIGGRKQQYNSIQKASLLNYAKEYGARKTARINKISTNTIRKRQIETRTFEKQIDKFKNLNYIPEGNLYGYRLTNI